MIEAALAHGLKDKAEAACGRGDLFAKRRRLMEDWIAYLARPEAAIVSLGGHPSSDRARRLGQAARA